MVCQDRHPGARAVGGLGEVDKQASRSAGTERRRTSQRATGYGCSGDCPAPGGGGVRGQGGRSGSLANKDTTAAIFWLKNRKPWRDVQQLQSELGVYILSYKPLSEQEWIEQRTVAEQKRPDATQVQYVPDTSHDTET
jgi:hypothetical protein